MNNDKDLEMFLITRAKNKSRNDRYIEFEYILRNCLCELKDKTDREDSFLLDDIKQTVIIYLMRTDCLETNDVFLSNVRDDFYRATNQLRVRHSDLDLKMKVIEMFMEDFYFDK